MMRELESKEIHIVCLINHLQTQRDTRSANNALMCVCMCAFRWSWQTQTMIAAHRMQSCCFCIAILCLRAFNYSTARRKHIRVQCKQESLHAHVPLNRIAENPVRAYHKRIAHQRNVNMFYLWLGIHLGMEREESEEVFQRESFKSSPSFHSAESEPLFSSLQVKVGYLPCRIGCWRQTDTLNLTFVWFIIKSSNSKFSKHFLFSECQDYV